MGKAKRKASSRHQTKLCPACRTRRTVKNFKQHYAQCVKSKREMIHYERA